MPSNILFYIFSSHCIAAESISSLCKRRRVSYTCPQHRLIREVNILRIIFFVNPEFRKRGKSYRLNTSRSVSHVIKYYYSKVISRSCFIFTGHSFAGCPLTFYRVNTMDQSVTDPRRGCITIFRTEMLADWFPFCSPPLPPPRIFLASREVFPLLVWVCACVFLFFTMKGKIKCSSEKRVLSSRGRGWRNLFKHRLQKLHTIIWRKIGWGEGRRKKEDVCVCNDAKNNTNQNSKYCTCDVSGWKNISRFPCSLPKKIIR